MEKRRWPAAFAAAALLLGGLREPRLAALGEAAVFAAVWLENPALGPALWWLPWLGWAFLSAALSLQPFAALQFLARWSAVLAFFSLAAAWDAKEREVWLKALLIASPILAAAALWTGAPLGFRATMTGLIPPYYNYTTFALSAGVTAAAVWALHPRNKRQKLRPAAIGVAALGALCLILAHGRGALLGVFCAGIVWAGRRWGARASLAALIAAGLAGAVFESGLVPQPVRSAVLQHGGSLRDVRADIWRRAADVAAAKPWLGEGPGSFGAAFRLQPVETPGGAARWGMNTDYAHSEFLQAAAETGYAGLILWLAGLGLSVVVLARRADDEPAREAAAVAVVAMAVHLLVDNMLQIPGLAFLFFSALAVAGWGPFRGPRWPRAAAAVGLGLALIGWVPRVLADGDPARAALLYPRDAYAREDMAYKATSAGDIFRADALWAQAAERAPCDAVYPWRRAQIAAARGRWEDAAALAARAEVLEPDFLNDRVLRAEALNRLGRRADARAELDSVLRMLRERSELPVTSKYDEVVFDFDRREFDRVSASVAY